MRKIRSLIVCGHASFRKALKIYLEEMDAVEAVETAADGEEAATLNETFEPHLLIMDGCLKTLDRLLESLYSVGRRPLGKILIYASYDPETLLTEKGIPADDCFFQEDLFEKLPGVIYELMNPGE